MHVFIPSNCFKRKNILPEHQTMDYYTVEQSMVSCHFFRHLTYNLRPFFRGFAIQEKNHLSQVTTGYNNYPIHDFTTKKIPFSPFHGQKSGISRFTPTYTTRHDECTRRLAPHAHYIFISNGERNKNSLRHQSVSKVFLLPHIKRPSKSARFHGFAPIST